MKFISSMNALLAAAMAGGKSEPDKCVDPLAKTLRKLRPKPEGRALGWQRDCPIKGNRGKGTRKQRKA